MKRRLWLIPAAALTVFLDCFVFTGLSVNGIRPLFTLSLALAATGVTKVQDGMLIAFFGGLLSDLFCNPYLGLSAAAYLAAVTVMHGFVRKSGKKIWLFPLFAAVGAIAAETLIFGFSVVIGAAFDPLKLLRTTLPSIVLEALLVLPLSALFRSRIKEKGNAFVR